MDQTSKRVPIGLAWLAVAAGLGAAPAEAAVSTAIDVTDLRVSVTAVVPGATAGVSFAGASGSTAECDASFGLPPTTDTAFAASGQAFGEVTGTSTPDPAVGGDATLAGDVFGAGAHLHASAFASGPGATVQSTLGLADGVSAASFILAPGSRMTITANVRATASVTGENATETADSGLSFVVSDLAGGGLQFRRVTLDAFAWGLLGPGEDVETAVVDLVYENDTDTAIAGLFSGYVSSYAYGGDPVSAVPEPGGGWLLVAGLLGVGAGSRLRRRGPPRARP